MIIRCEIFEIGNFVCSFLLRPQVKNKVKVWEINIKFFSNTLKVRLSFL